MQVRELFADRRDALRSRVRCRGRGHTFEASASGCSRFSSRRVCSRISRRRVPPANGGSTCVQHPIRVRRPASTTFRSGFGFVSCAFGVSRRRCGTACGLTPASRAGSTRRLRTNPCTFLAVCGRKVNGLARVANPCTFLAVCGRKVNGFARLRAAHARWRQPVNHGPSGRSWMPEAARGQGAVLQYCPWSWVASGAARSASLRRGEIRERQARRDPRAMTRGTS